MGEEMITYFGTIIEISEHKVLTELELMYPAIDFKLYSLSGLDCEDQNREYIFTTYQIIMKINDNQYYFNSKYINFLKDEVIIYLKKIGIHRKRHSTNSSTEII